MIKGRNKRRLFRITRRSDFVRKFLPVCVTLAIVFVGAAQITKNVMDQYQHDLSIDSATTSVFEIDSTSQFPGATDAVKIKANPGSSDQTLAMIRLKLQNATVLDVTPGNFMTLGACPGGALFTDNSICVDISNGDPFTRGDVLLTATVRWGETGAAQITAADGNGYYNGVDTSAQNVTLAVDVNGQLPLTGGNDSDQLGQLIADNPAFFLLTGVILIGSVIGVMVLAVRKKDSPTWRRVSLIYSMGVVLLLAGSSVFVGNYLQQNKVNPETSSALSSSVYEDCPSGVTFNCLTQVLIGGEICEVENGNLAISCQTLHPMKCMKCLNCQTHYSGEPIAVPNVTCETANTAVDQCFTANNGVGYYNGAHCNGNRKYVCSGYKTVAGSIQDCAPGFCVNGACVPNNCPNGTGCLDKDTVICCPNKSDTCDNSIYENHAYCKSQTKLSFDNSYCTLESSISGPLTAYQLYKLTLKIKNTTTDSFYTSGNSPIIRVKMTSKAQPGTIDNAWISWYGDTNQVDTPGAEFVYIFSGYTTPNNDITFLSLDGKDVNLKISFVKSYNGYDDTRVCYDGGLPYVSVSTTPVPTATALATPTPTPTRTPTPVPSSTVTPSRAPTPGPSTTVAPSSTPSPSTAVDRCGQVASIGWNGPFTPGNLGKYCYSVYQSGSTILLTCDYNKHETTHVDCAPGTCKVAAPGQNDYCVAATTPAPSATPVVPTPTHAATPTPAPSVAPSVSAPPGKMACGTMKCQQDSDCMTGLPDYECDESNTDWPNNNQCVKVCGSGQTRVDACHCASTTPTVTPTVSTTPSSVVCGLIDVNGDGILNYIDFYAFSKVYNHTCSDTPPTTGCGGKDTNGDGKIDYRDFYTFSQKYYPRASSCL